MKTKFKVLNSKGEQIVLNDMQKRMANYNQKIVNALGYNVDITTLTEISAQVVEQKFFEVAPSDYLPVVVGQGAWKQNITHFRSFLTGDDFLTGIINTGKDDSRLATAGVGIDNVNQKINSWAKDINWTLPDLQYAQNSGNWDLITELEKSRKKNWDLGIQRVAFIGAPDLNIFGLLNQPGIAANTSVISEAISGMTATELETFAAAILADYRQYNSQTQWPDRFVIPEADYLGLGVFVSTTQPITKLQFLENLFKLLTKKPNFQILPLAYANSVDISGTAKRRYVLYVSEQDSIRMDIPVSYTNTMANSINGFQFHNVGYGQFTGAIALRPKSIRYYEYNAP